MMQQTNQIHSTQHQIHSTQHASSSGRTGRCAEVCMDLLSMETTRFFSKGSRGQGDGGPPAAAALEAMGIRVGKQLAERCARGRCSLLNDACSESHGSFSSGKPCEPPWDPYVTLILPTLSPPTSRPWLQNQPRPPSHGGSPRGRQVHVQGVLDRSVQEAGRQLEDQPQGESNQPNKHRWVSQSRVTRSHVCLQYGPLAPGITRNYT